VQRRGRYCPASGGLAGARGRSRGSRSRGSRRHPTHRSRLGRRGSRWRHGCLSSWGRSSPRTGIPLGITWASPFGQSGSLFSSDRSCCSSSGHDDVAQRRDRGLADGNAFLVGPHRCRRQYRRTPVRQVDGQKDQESPRVSCPFRCPGEGHGRRLFLHQLLLGRPTWLDESTERESVDGQSVSSGGMDLVEFVRWCVQSRSPQSCSCPSHRPREHAAHPLPSHGIREPLPGFELPIFPNAHTEAPVWHSRIPQRSRSRRSTPGTLPRYVSLERGQDVTTGSCVCTGGPR